ncbi:MAG: FKBP-type peptidyl-prolyl cis-trans isomerase, partial [bacterium]|nr:FKBP-type peptidyl-prolyl cis-trans isomerase [bacterium]
GDGFRHRGIEIDSDVFLRGLLDGIEKNTTLLEDEEVVRALQMLERKLVAGIRESERIQMAEQNLKLAQAWLRDNKEKEGVVVLESGLQYKILEASTGPKPTSERDTVKVNYRGKLINGQEFDSSYRRGIPSRFALNGVILGWTEGLQLMPTGSIWELYIPPHLGYGDQQSGAIEPNSMLIFEVKLLEVTLENPAGN